MGVTEIRDEAGFHQALANAKSKLVVVDFFATWCGPCKTVAPLFDGWSREYDQQAVFLKVDVDQVREVAQSAGVKSLPSFGFYHQGRLLELVVGGDPRIITRKITTLAEKHSVYAFKGPGNSMLGPSSSAAAPSAAAAKPAGGAAPSGRRNPWADPNFHLAKAATTAKPAATADAKPTAAASATPAASKPAASATTAAPAASASGAARANPWATKEIPKAAPAPAPAAAAPAPVASPPAAAAAPAAAASSSPSPPPSATASATPADDASTAVAAAASASAPAASSSSAAAAGPVANDPALVKQLNPTFLASLTDMGFGQVRAEKALILTGNKGFEPALNWLMEHEADADIDEPLQVVGSQAKPPAGVNLDDMDEDERAIYENFQSKKLAEKGVAFSSGANVAPAKVSTLNMTTEEKMAWLAKRRAEVKAQKEVSALESMKEAERTRQRNVKGAQAIEELKEQMQRKAADDAIKAKKKENEDKKRARAATLAKLEEAKQRRREEQERTMAAIAAQKAAAEAAKAAK